MPSWEILRGVYTERSECAQNDSLPPIGTSPDHFTEIAKTACACYNRLVERSKANIGYGKHTIGLVNSLSRSSNCQNNKIQIWQTLDAELNRDEIHREFAHTLEEIWSANEHVAEAEVNAEIEQALHEVRAENPTRRS